MKKILPFFLFLLLSVTAMAGETFTFNDLLHWSGSDSTFGSGSNSKGAWDFFTDVKVTDNEDGTYDVELCKFVMFKVADCGNIIFKNVPGTSTATVTRLSTNGERVEGTVVGGKYEGNETKMTIEGAFLRNGEQLYLYMEGLFEGWTADDPFKITFGTPIEGETTTYNEPAKITYAGLTVEHESDKINLVDKGDNKYRLIYKDFKFTKDNYMVGDYTVDEITPTEDADGFMNINYTGTAKISNVGQFGAQVGFYDGQEVPFSIKGKFKDGRMQAQLTVCVTSAANATVEFGVDPSEWTPTAISGVEADSNNAATEIFTVGGMKVNKLQKGLNIVRRGGKTVKVAK